jgi:hypothetical protein
MSIWIELRCSKQKAPDCPSSRNEGPMSMAADTQASIGQVLSVMRAAARRTGWSHDKRGRWTCKACAALEANPGASGTR